MTDLRRFSFLIFILFSQLLSQLVYRLFKPVVGFDFSIYCWDSIIIAAFWLWWTLVLDLFSPKIRPWACVFTGMSYSFVLLLNGFLFLYFRQFLNKDFFAFIWSDPQNSWVYLTSTLAGVHGVTFMLVAGLVFFIWQNTKGDFLFTRQLPRIGALLVLPVLIAVLLNQVRRADGRWQMGFETATMLSIKRAFTYRNKEMLKASYNRTPVVGPGRRVNYNVLLFLVESWGKNPLTMYGHSSKATPFFTTWQTKNPEAFFIFQHAFSNASATDVSVPSVLTGVAPGEENSKLHQMPIIWDWGRAAQMHTFFISSQSLAWQNFDRFILVPGPDYYQTAAEIDAPLINDLGVDDMLMGERVLAHLQGIKPGEKFLGVITPNALHAPYQQASSQFKPPVRFPSRYANALQIVDRVFERVVKKLEQLGQLDHTIIIFSADHGDFDALHHALPRLFNFYDEIMNIPFMIFLPAAFRRENPQVRSILQRNTGRLISNLDIIPTIAHLLNLDLDPVNQQILGQLKGRNIFMPLSPDHVVEGLNTNDVKTLNPEGFGLFFPFERFIYTTVQGAQFFDVRKDKMQKQNLWSSLSAPRKAQIVKRITGSRHLKRIFEKK